MSSDARPWDTDLTEDELGELAEALRREDFMNWPSEQLARRLAGTVRAIAAARLTAYRASTYLTPEVIAEIEGRIPHPPPIEVRRVRTTDGLILVIGPFKS